MQKVPVFNFKIGNVAPQQGGGKSLDVYIDGAIVDAETQQIFRDYFGDDTSVSYRSFRDSIEEVKPSVLNVFCTGPGGHVHDALAMHDYLLHLQTEGVTVNVTNRGMVASALTFMLFAVPKENRFASANSVMLIHNVSGGTFGTLQQMESYVESCRKANTQIANLYVSNSNLSATRIANMMDFETELWPNELLQYEFIPAGNVIGASVVKSNGNIQNYGIRSTAVMNTYNSFFNSNQNDMDLAQEMRDGFAALRNLINGKENKPLDNVAIVNQLGSLETTITNALAAQNTAMANLLTGEAFTNAVDARLSNLATTEALAEANTQLVTANENITALQTDLANIRKDVTNKLGNGTNTRIVNEETPTGGKGRYAGKAPAQN